LHSVTVDDSISPDRNRADDLMKSGRPAEAVPLYRTLVETYPEENSHLLALAWALHDSGKTDEAAACFEQLFRKELARGLFTGFAYDELVRIYREGNNGEALVSVCERTAAAQPGDVGILQTLGEAYLSTGRAAEAERVFEKLTELEPDAPEHWCSLGDARLAAGDPGQAESAYNRAVEIDPAAKAAFCSRLADGLFRTGYPERAREAWERSLRVCPDEPFCWMGIGDCLVRLGKPDAAAEAYGRAADLQPAAAGGFWHRLGRSLTREGLHSRATEAFIKAVAAEPGNSLYLLRLAESYAAQGRGELAAETLRRAVALKPSSAGR
jgi:tetratricopeptide (TPR) repeat protein